MPDAADAVEFVRLDRPETSLLLDRFSSGEDQHGRRANGIVAELRDEIRESRTELTAIAMRRGAATLGACAYRLLPLYPIEAGQDDAYLHIIAVDADFQRKGLGRMLLACCMTSIAADWGRLPDIWAYVSPTNRASHALFETSGFSYLPPAEDGHDAIRFKPCLDSDRVC
jgi:ribosomal protein S18 acetylase RimI-like enzyme